MTDQNEDFLVSVFDVHKDNLQLVWPCLTCAIRNASFVALDCELSGLGTKKLINSQAVDDRYKNISHVAKTRSIISIGLSCFKMDSDSFAANQSLKCNVQTFNLMALCSEEYTVEPNALQFLVSHGFDFQKQYAQGIPYYRGQDKDTSEDRRKKSCKWDLRDVFGVLVAAKVPIVLHNGLVDLVFLYQNLYAELPSTLSSFVSDLEMMFPVGIYDTKYIAEFSQRMSASFLEFVFRSHQLRNIKSKAANQGHVICYHSLLDSNFTDSWDCSPRFQDAEDAQICTTYINHGFCPSRSECSKSHDVFRAVVLEDQKKTRKRKRKDAAVCQVDFSLSIYTVEPSARQHFKGHRAGHDAFMTGFCFSSFVAQNLSHRLNELEKMPCWTEVVTEARNRICLSGKDFPLLIQKSGFAKCSKGHLEKYSRLVPEHAKETNAS